MKITSTAVILATFIHFQVLLNPAALSNISLTITELFSYAGRQLWARCKLWLQGCIVKWVILNNIKVYYNYDHNLEMEDTVPGFRAVRVDMLLVPALSLGFIAAARGPLFLPTVADAVRSLCLLFGSCLWGWGSIWLVELWCECREQIFLLFSPQIFIDVCLLTGSEPIVTECPFSVFFLPSWSRHRWRCAPICDTFFPENLHLS